MIFPLPAGLPCTTCTAVSASTYMQRQPRKFRGCYILYRAAVPRAEVHDKGTRLGVLRSGLCDSRRLYACIASVPQGLPPYGILC